MHSVGSELFHADGQTHTQYLIACTNYSRTHNYAIWKHRQQRTGIFLSVINQLDAQNFCFTISLFHASTCFEHMCSKHIEAWNKLIVEQNFCASNRLITDTNILRCTVSKTSKKRTGSNGVISQKTQSPWTPLSEIQISIYIYTKAVIFFCVTRAQTGPRPPNCRGS